MKDLTYEQHLTGLLVIDPYNDFISPGGKVWPRVQEVAEATSCVSNMKAVLEAARRANLRIFFALHHRYRARDYETWKYLAPIQREAWEHKTFEDGTWGGEIHPDFLPQPGETIAQEHWCSSGFANTDLDLLLKKHGIHKLVIIGLKANTCIESTVRHAIELGYEVTMVKDATASFSWDEMKASLEINLPSYASAILTAQEMVNKLAKG